MAVCVKVSCADEIGRLRQLEYFCGREKRSVSEQAVGFAPLRLRGVRIDRILIASMQSDDAAVRRSIRADQIRHAVFVKISRGQSCGRSELVLQRSASPLCSFIIGYQVVAVAEIDRRGDESV